MRKFRPRLRAYLVAVYLLAVASVALAFATPAHASNDLFLGGVLFSLAAVARSRPVHIGPKTKITVEETATFAAALLLSPAVASLLAGMSNLAGGLPVRKRSLYNRVFNASAATIATAGAAIVFRLLAPPDGALFVNVLAVPAAAVTNYLVRTEIVDGAVSLQLGRPLLASWWSDHRRDLGQQIALFMLGALAAAVSAYPLAIVLFAVPMSFVLLSLRETTRMRADTKAAIVELADLIDQRDRYTYRHSVRVAEYANRLARHLRLSTAQVELVTEAARVHDIGKITTPDVVLQKPGPLADDELEVMRRHAESGHELLRRLPEFWEGASLVLSHHERVDGMGYPRGLDGSSLPLEVSIIAVCDAYDAMSSDRVYRPALAWAQIEAELRRGRGTQWAAEAVDGLLVMLEADRPATAAELAAVGVPAGARS